MEGTFKWYNGEKGYGFIIGADSKDYFVHYSALPQGQANIKEEDNVKVTFDAKETERGIQAQNIVIVGANSDSDEE